MLFDFDKWPGEYLTVCKIRQVVAAGNVELERPSSTRYLMASNGTVMPILQFPIFLAIVTTLSVIVTLNSDQFGIFDTEARWPSRS